MAVRELPIKMENENEIRSKVSLIIVLHLLDDDIKRSLRLATVLSEVLVGTRRYENNPLPKTFWAVEIQRSVKVRKGLRYSVGKTTHDFIGCIIGNATAVVVTVVGAGGRGSSTTALDTVLMWSSAGRSCGMKDSLMMVQNFSVRILIK